MSAGARAAAPAMLPLLADTARGLFPGYFALVMATGVVSIACQLLGLRMIALPLVVIAWTAHLVLWALTIPRRSIARLSMRARLRTWRPSARNGATIRKPATAGGAIYSSPAACRAPCTASDNVSGNSP